MASLTRRMQRRLTRTNQHKLRNCSAGSKLGVTNARAPKPCSLPARGSRRTLNSNWRSTATLAA